MRRSTPPVSPPAEETIPAACPGGGRACRTTNVTLTGCPAQDAGAEPMMVRRRNRARTQIPHRGSGAPDSPYDAREMATRFDHPVSVGPNPATFGVAASRARAGPPWLPGPQPPRRSARKPAHPFAFDRIATRIGTVLEGVRNPQDGPRPDPRTAPARRRDKALTPQNGVLIFTWENCRIELETPHLIRSHGPLSKT